MEKHAFRRQWFNRLLAAFVTYLCVSAQVLAAEVVEVYKSPSCGCCALWVSHLERAGFVVKTHDSADLAQLKDEHGLPFELRSCHTATVGGYIIEGHVPASDIQRLIEQRPRLKGIAVPGMPIGSPGMEVPGRAPDRYTVYGFDEQGKTTRYASH